MLYDRLELRAPRAHDSWLAARRLLWLLHLAGVTVVEDVPVLLDQLVGLVVLVDVCTELSASGFPFSHIEAYAASRRATDPQACNECPDVELRADQACNRNPDGPSTASVAG